VRVRVCLCVCVCACAYQTAIWKIQQTVLVCISYKQYYL